MEPSKNTYDLGLLESSRMAWDRNASLRVFYKSLFRDIQSKCSGQEVLEVGSGIAVSRSVFDNLVTTDIEKTEYVDRAMSAYNLEPQEDGRPWSDIIAVDVLHHLQEPLRFLESAARVLRPGGRIILMEPAGTTGGCAFYRLFHHEPIRVAEACPPFVYTEPNHDGGFANMGMGMGLFVRNKNWTGDWLAPKGLSVDTIEYRDLMAYPLTGGYSKTALLPSSLIRHLLRLESKLPQWLLSFLGLRMCVVLSKAEPDTVAD